MPITNFIRAATASLAIMLVLCGCRSDHGPAAKQLTLAVNSGVEGDALKQAALDYEKQTGVHINIAEFQFLTDLAPLMQKRGQGGPDADFVPTSIHEITRTLPKIGSIKSN